MGGGTDVGGQREVVEGNEGLREVGGIVLVDEGGHPALPYVIFPPIQLVGREQ